MSGARRELAAEIAILMLFYAALALPLLAVSLSFAIVAIETTGGDPGELATLFQARVYIVLGATIALPGMALAGLAWGIRRLAHSWSSGDE